MFIAKHCYIYRLKARSGPAAMVPAARQCEAATQRRWCHHRHSSSSHACYQHTSISLGPAAVPLGTMPPLAALAGLAVFSPTTPATMSSASTAAALSSSLTSSASPAPPAGPSRQWRVPSSCHLLFPRLGQNWITTQQFVAVKELLADNMALHGKLEDLPAQTSAAARTHRLREIDLGLLLSRLCCFPDQGRGDS